MSVTCQVAGTRKRPQKDFLENLKIEKRTSSRMCTFCPVLSNQKAFLLISCVFWTFFQNTGSQLRFRFFFMVILPGLIMLNRWKQLWLNYIIFGADAPDVYATRWFSEHRFIEAIMLRQETRAMCENQLISTSSHRFMSI